jgi:hypothetical protein
MPSGDALINVNSTPQPTAPQPQLPVDKPKGSGFWGALGRIGTAALNFVAPGAGNLVGAFVGGAGGGLDYSNMQVMLQQQAEQSMAMLAIQNRVQTQTQEFTTVSNLLKARHDGEMSAVNNFKS